MQKLFNILRWVDPAVRFTLLVVTAAEVAMDVSRNPFNRGILFLCLTVLIVVDIGRLLLPAVQRRPMVFFILSMSVSLLICLDKESDLIQIYYFFLMGDIFHTQRGKKLKALIAAHFTGFVAVWCCAQLAREQKGLEQYVQAFLLLSAIYALILFIFASIHYFKREQERLKVMNADLIEYSFEEREYLIAKERSSISQELHDSLGHSLMAVLMNVRYLKAIQSKSEDERKKQLAEIEKLLKECVSNLRNSVYSLKELDENIHLKDEIERVIQKFRDLDLVDISMEYSARVESAPNYVKTVLFKTIREGITNSIRHGNASSIQISILCIDQNIEMIIKDNGSGCEDIQKSFGLNGIVDRVKEVGGEVWFISQKGKGFTIKTLLPGGNTN